MNFNVSKFLIFVVIAITTLASFADTALEDWPLCDHKGSEMGRLMYWTPLVFLAVFLCHLQMSAACSCSYKHPQHQFCDADVVALVTVEDFAKVEGNPWIDQYKVHLNQTFKVKPEAQDAMEQKPLWLRTSALQSMCGLQGITPGQTWVIAGYIGDGHLTVSSCNFAILWSNITPRQREGFQQLYQPGCACLISYSSWSEQEDGERCHSARPPGLQHCQTLYGICKFESERCSWESSTAYDDCVKQYLNEQD